MHCRETLTIDSSRRDNTNNAISQNTTSLKQTMPTALHNLQPSKQNYYLQMEGH